MGITIIQKSDLKRKRPRATKALILAGGAVTGGSFKAGGIKAFNDYLDGSRIGDFDIFVGISSGSLIAAPLIGGLSPESILKSLDGTSDRFSELTAWHYYRPNVGEFLSRPLGFLLQAASLIPRGIAGLAREGGRDGLMTLVWRFLTDPTVARYDAMMERFLLAFGEGLPSLLSLLPSGLFDNAPIERYIRENIERNGLTNDFAITERLTGKRLYISAMRLDGAERVVFGPDEDDSLTISEAIQASTALPGFYKPARIRGVDYVDGGVHETANIDVAIEKGAELIVCYNPFRPYDSEAFVEGLSRGRRGERLAASGIMTVLNQIFRAFFHARLHVALDHFRRSPHFRGDIILIEPRADDAAFFALNPLLLKHRVRAAQMGFESVRNSIEDHYDEIRAILAAYGMRLSRRGVEREYRALMSPTASEGEIQRLLEGRRKRMTPKRARAAKARPKRAERVVRAKRARKGKRR